jgi:hypothetical protein
VHAHRSPAWIVPPLLVAATLPALGWLALGPPIGAGVLAGPAGAGAIQLGAPAPAHGDSAVADRFRTERAVEPIERHPVVPPCPAADGSRPAGSVPPAVSAGFASSAERYRADGLLTGDGSLAGWELTAGETDGLRLHLPPESAVRGPVHGRITVATDDGSSSRVHGLVPSAGCGALIVESADVIRQAIETPDGQSVVFHALNRADRSDRGIWRLSIREGGAAQPLLPGIGPGDRLTDEIGQVWATGLQTSADGRWLAVESCGAEACRIRLARLGADGQPVVGSFPGRLVDFDDRWLLTLGECDGLACDLTATDLVTGRARVLASSVSSATSVWLDGRLLAVAFVEAAEPRLIVVDPATGSRWSAPGGIDGAPSRTVLDVPRLLPRGGAAEAGWEAPPGWIGATIGPPARIVGIDVAAIAAGQPETER